MKYINKNKLYIFTLRAVFAILLASTFECNAICLTKQCKEEVKKAEEAYLRWHSENFAIDDAYEECYARTNNAIQCGDTRNAQKRALPKPQVPASLAKLDTIEQDMERCENACQKNPHPKVEELSKIRLCKKSCKDNAENLFKILVEKLDALEQASASSAAPAKH